MKTCRLVLAAGLLVALGGSAAAQQPETDRKIAGGGVTAPGWKGKEDAGNRQGLTVADSKFAAEGKGFHVVTGPPALYWSDSHTATGDYAVRATFTEAKQGYTHPHPYGVFIAGQALESGAPTALYCAAYRNGTYIVRGFSGGKRFDVVAKPAASDAVRKAASPDEQVVQEVGWNVRGDTLECVINGTAVWRGTKADVTGPGKLTTMDGVAGIRVSHNSDALVTGFEVK